MSYVVLQLAHVAIHTVICSVRDMPYIIYIRSTLLHATFSTSYSTSYVFLLPFSTLLYVLCRMVMSFSVYIRNDNVDCQNEKVYQQFFVPKHSHTLQIECEPMRTKQYI